MAPASVLGKRTGPIEGTSTESRPLFSSTPSSSVGSTGSSADSEVYNSSSASSSSTSSTPQQQHLQNHHQPTQPRSHQSGQQGSFKGPALGKFAVPPGNRAQITQLPFHPAQFMSRQVSHEQHPPLYINDYFKPQQQQHPLFPQSPPQETYIRPSIEDFGEKRRKFNDIGQLKQYPLQMPVHQMQSPQQYQFSPQEMQQSIHPQLIPQLAAPVVAPPSLILQTQNQNVLPPHITQHPPLLHPAPQVASQPPQSQLKKQKPPNITLPKIVDGMWWEDCDDEDGHYIVKPGEKFASRYTIVKLLGQGTFGKVAQVYDDWTQRHCAIKIIRAVPKYRDASKIELRVLTLLRTCDPDGLSKCVRMQECFDYRNHVCIVTDLYDISVYDFLKWNQYNPFPGKHIQHFAKQILTSVAYIHSFGIVHTDLKPENVLLASSTTLPHIDGTSRTGSGNKRTKERASSASSSKRNYGSPKVLQNTDVTLIDFGSAVFDDEYHSSVVSTRHYRAPEIIYGTGWSYPCDLWSIGCVLIELCTGRVLFETRDNLEHLHMMEKTLSRKFSAQQLSAAASTSEGSSLVSTRGWFPKLNPLTLQTQIDSVSKMKTISELIYSYTSASERYFWDGFLDLISKLMTLDPAQRITASEALRHPWITSN